MRILGIDPGLRVTGYGVIDAREIPYHVVEAGVVKSTAKAGIGQRLKEIYQGSSDLLKDVKPDCVVLEKLFAHHRHPATALLMGHARGVICLAASLANVPIVSLPSTHVKKSILSYGRASKEQMRKGLSSFLRVPFVHASSDVSDALAIAVSFALNHSKPERFSHARGRRHRIKFEEVGT